MNKEVLEILLEEEGYLFNEYPLNGKIIDHILVNQTGIYVIKDYEINKFLTGKGDDEFLSELRRNPKKAKQYPNPAIENEKTCYDIVPLLEGCGVYMVNLVVFTNDNCDLIDCENVCNLEELDDLINSFDEVYSEEEMYKIIEIFQENLNK